MNYIKKKLLKRKFSKITDPKNFEIDYDGYVRVCGIYDADTITVIFKYNNEYQKFKIRLSGIDTPELRTTDEREKKMAYMARNKLCEYITKKKFTTQTKKRVITDYLKEKCFLVYIKTHGLDKYGRLLASVYKNKNDNMSLNQHLIEDKFALPYNGGTKQKFTF